MELLRARDIVATLELIRKVYAASAPDQWIEALFLSLPKLVAVDAILYREGEMLEPRPLRRTLPLEIFTPARAQLWGRLRHEHPLVSYFYRKGPGNAVKLSNFLTARQFHRLAIYNDVYREIHTEDILGFPFLTDRGEMIGVVIHRGRPFSERDQQMMNLLRPHLIQGYSNASALAQAAHHRTLMNAALEEGAPGVIALNKDRRIHFATSLGRKLLKEYFDDHRSSDRLPEPLDLWIRHHDAQLCKVLEIPPPRNPLIVHRERKRLLVRLQSKADGFILLVEEESTVPEPSYLVGIGLTSRESDVLAQVATGKTNAEVGNTLGLSLRTVKTHLEHIYGKLGVKTRVAAVRKAFHEDRSASTSVMSRKA